MKNAINELIFLVVTHTAYFDTRFGSYGFFKSGYGAEQILDRLIILVIHQILGPQEARNLPGFENGF
jgi:hypothetical protein